MWLVSFRMFSFWLNVLLSGYYGEGNKCVGGSLILCFFFGAGEGKGRKFWKEQESGSIKAWQIHFDFCGFQWMVYLFIHSKLYPHVSNVDK